MNTGPWSFIASMQACTSEMGFSMPLAMAYFIPRLHSGLVMAGGEARFLAVVHGRGDGFEPLGRPARHVLLHVFVDA